MDEQGILLRALKEKSLQPFGGNREVGINIQLIAGTNRNLQLAARQGCFRDDLLARTNLWTFHLPGLRQRLEGIEPNLDYELEQFPKNSSKRVNMSKDVRDAVLRFVTCPFSCGSQPPSEISKANVSNSRVLPATSASPSIFMTSPPRQERILSHDATIPSQVARTALTCFFW